MRQLDDFQGLVTDAKRRLKEAYYTASDGDTRADAKELVTTVISIEKAVESLINMGIDNKMARSVLTDRRVEVMLSKWSTGLPARVHDYVKRQKSLPSHLLHRYYEVLHDYLEEIIRELSTWTSDIQALIDTPSPPKD